MSYRPQIIDNISTPYYYYDMALLQATIDSLAKASQNMPLQVHYAIKANNNPEILRAIAARGLGADCVSGGEVSAAIDAGFAPDKIFYAGVGKTDHEIKAALLADIGCFNVESLEEIHIINDIASSLGLIAPVALRINPDIDAHTHHYITTGLEENKFGIALESLDEAVDTATSLPALRLRGLHFHIGSQITITEPYKLLCLRVNEINNSLHSRGIDIEFVNLGGGLAIDYENPDENPIPDFKSMLDTIRQNLVLRPGQSIHIEPGRSLVGQCGSLIARVIYIKQSEKRRFAILDAGMTDLIRPALYGAYHRIENLSAKPDSETLTYDIVGPICESTDVFAKDIELPCLHRGDYVALRSAGAYGQSMASSYNMRPAAKTIIMQADSTIKTAF